MTIDKEKGLPIKEIRREERKVFYVAIDVVKEIIDVAVEYKDLIKLRMKMLKFRIHQTTQ